ncbi:MAG TPA: DUF962 domain-containing protein [Candidatus Acidoferrum sp.]|nr:DUF962 domain-containing protein [Candidatus Acidoferrum sp.]
MDDAFWLRYLRAHADLRTRTIHAAGTTIASAILASAIVRRDPRLVPLAFLCGYGPAWYAHAFVERNKPETFSAPLRSLAADYRMWWGIVTRSLDADLRRAAADEVEAAG